MARSYYRVSSKSFARGSVIFSENTEADGFFIIIEGEVEIFRDQGEERIQLCCLGTGDIFGEMSIINQERRSAGARALTPVLCKHVTMKVMRDVLKNTPPWFGHLVQLLCDRLRDTSDRLQHELAVKDGRRQKDKRIESSLIMLTDKGRELLDLNDDEV